MNSKLIKYLEQFVTDRRVQLFDTVLNNRTRYITVALEDIYQPHNASAVLRSCECFGIQDVHIIENRNKYSINPDVALGSYKWLNMYRYYQEPDNTPAALESLKKAGYRIVATTPHNNQCTLNDFDLLKGKTALLFGTELEGLSPVALSMADEYLVIPMTGFTESLNISVTAAIIIHQLVNKLHDSGIDWHLTTEERQAIKLIWLKNTIRKSDRIINKFFEDQELNKNSQSFYSDTAND